MDRSAWRDWRKRWRQCSVWPSSLSKSGFENIDRALDHAARGADDVDVGLIGTLGLAQIRHLDQRIDVGVFDIAVCIGRRMARLMLDAKFRLVGLDAAKPDKLR